ncbi:putative carboxylesterase 17 [Acorus gramineus]|uniref:Carboxylesterase 17 n=1 Tax=Acorus gramineus TaxID=55184 RepID=A0AAV9AFE9_ACOGR|nr:putative carboxylesterase 17 [Acorus gramineus]
MARRKMGATSPTDPKLKNQHHHHHEHHSSVIEEIKGLIRVCADGHVDRFPIMPQVLSTALPPDAEVHCRDAIIDISTHVWARIYVPNNPTHDREKLPLLLYFHGGGFCVGSASWACYHDFLARLTSVAGCVVVSVNYRLAPEHRLPAAYDDGLAALKWVRRQRGDDASLGEQSWWRSRCDFARVFVGGDSAGACIAYNAVAARSAPRVRGLVLIQPFFGGEARTASERRYAREPNSALALSASDAYWRMALPAGAGRDHPWCNPLMAAGKGWRGMPAMFVGVAEIDVLRDRNAEFCAAMRRAGVGVVQVMSAGVGHAFHVLHNSQLAQQRGRELMLHVKDFILDR